MKPLLLTLLLVTGTAHAGDWIIYARDPDNTVYKYEPKLITHHDNRGKAIMVWERYISPAEVTVTTKYELHCPSHSYRIHYQTMIGATSKYQNVTPDTQWYYAVPDSTQMALIQLICTEYE
jgi:hypothetical protein